MQPIPILSGVYIDAVADFRVSYPRNMEPVAKSTGISDAYLRPAEGIVPFATGPGTDRGCFVWDQGAGGILYRVMGTKLVRVNADQTVSELGDVGPGGRVTIDNGFGYLSIWSGGRLYYWDGASLVQVTDPDLGTVIDGCWIAGYNMSTDGEFLIVTDLSDKTSVNPLKYGSSESDPDPILAVDELRNEAYAFNRFTIEAFQNIGGSGFPFQRIDGAAVTRGIIGTHAYASFLDSFAFVGGGKNDGRVEPASVWIMGAGTVAKIATDEIDKILARYTDAQLVDVVVESRLRDGRQLLYVHLPDQTWVYDATSTERLRTPIWYQIDSGNGTAAQYRARDIAWCYGRWIAGDPTSSALGSLSDSISSHYGQTIGWVFGTLLIDNGGKGGIFHELELVCAPGRVAFGADPTIWTSYTVDGETWSQEKPCKAGKQGQRNKRIAWRKQGRMRLYRAQRFRGTSDAHVSVAKLIGDLEPLYG